MIFSNLFSKNNSFSTKKTKGFTILELLIGLFIISLAILAVIKMIDAANGHIKKIKQETIAINLAREGMEGMYNRRNTNRLRHSSEKDKYRLCIDDDCSVNWFNSSDGNYYALNSDGNSFREEPNEGQIRGKSLFLLRDDAFIGQKPSGSFYRAIIPIGLYQKDVNVTGGVAMGCQIYTDNYSKANFDNSSTTSVSCGDDTPKEFRFCTRVEYEGEGNGNVELCGSLTNYKE